MDEIVKALREELQSRCLFCNKVTKGIKRYCNKKCNLRANFRKKKMFIGFRVKKDSELGIYLQTKDNPIKFTMKLLEWYMRRSKKKNVYNK